MSCSVPSLWETCIVPERITPTWCTWQLSVPAIGLMHSDQRQPGSRVMREALVPPMRTISTLVLSGERVSSGAEKSRTSKPAIDPSSHREDPGDDPKPGLTPRQPPAASVVSADEATLRAVVP